MTIITCIAKLSELVRFQHHRTPNLCERQNEDVTRKRAVDKPRIADD